MTNILLNTSYFDANWCRPVLSQHLKAQQRVLVVGLAFRERQITSARQWRRFYGRFGKYSRQLWRTLAAYGIPRRQVQFLNYYQHSPEEAEQLVGAADVLLFPGGLPDLLYERLCELHLLPAMRLYNGVVLGISAGAMVQLARYHITPDKDYPAYTYANGCGWLADFDIEVHYNGSELQHESIRRAICEMGKPVYAIAQDGALLVQNGEISTIGTVRCFSRADALL